MQPFIGDLGRLAEQNDNFRRVLYTGPHTQLVAMMLEPGEEIGLETHHDVDQLFVVVEGVVEAYLDGARYELQTDGIAVVPAGMQHNFVNVGEDAARLITAYSPPEHADGTVHPTRAEAMREEVPTPA